MLAGVMHSMQHRYVGRCDAHSTQHCKLTDEQVEAEKPFQHQNHKHVTVR